LSRDVRKTRNPRCHVLTYRTCKLNHESRGFLRFRQVWAEEGDDRRENCLVSVQ